MDLIRGNRKSQTGSIASLAGSQLSNKGNKSAPGGGIAGETHPPFRTGHSGTTVENVAIFMTRFLSKLRGSMPRITVPIRNTCFTMNAAGKTRRTSRSKPPNLTLPERLANGRLTGRLDLLAHLDAEQAGFERILKRPISTGTASGPRPCCLIPKPAVRLMFTRHQPRIKTATDAILLDGPCSWPGNWWNQACVWSKSISATMKPGTRISPRFNLEEFSPFLSDADAAWPRCSLICKKRGCLTIPWW